jgi:hypothetical protein
VTRLSRAFARMDENSDGTGKPKDQQEEYSADRPQHVALAYVELSGSTMETARPWMLGAIEDHSDLNV